MRGLPKDAAITTHGPRSSGMLAARELFGRAPDRNGTVFGKRMVCHCQPGKPCGTTPCSTPASSTPTASSCPRAGRYATPLSRSAWGTASAAPLSRTRRLLCFGSPGEGETPGMSIGGRSGQSPDFRSKSAPDLDEHWCRLGEGKHQHESRFEPRLCGVSGMWGQDQGFESSDVPRRRDPICHGTLRLRRHAHFCP